MSERITIGRIQRVVARHFEVEPGIMQSAERKARQVRPRQIAMYLARVMLARSLPEIGRRFGGRDHTTVLHAERKIAAMVAADEAFAGLIEQLKLGIAGGDELVGPSTLPTPPPAVQQAQTPMVSPGEIDVMRKLRARGTAIASIAATLNCRCEEVEAALFAPPVEAAKTALDPPLAASGEDGDRFVAAMRAAIAAGLEHATEGVNTRASTRRPQSIATTISTHSAVGSAAALCEES